MDNTNKRILIAFPCRDRAWILPYFLEHLVNINYDKKLIDIYCIINNSSDSSHELMKEFKTKYNNDYNSIQVDVQNNSEYSLKDKRISHIRDKIYHWLAELRNMTVKKCVKLDCNYMLSIDTDILVPSDVLKNLLNHDKDYVASLIYNGYLFTPQNAEEGYNPILNAYKFPNILKLNNNGRYTHIVNYRVKNPNLCENDYLIDVDFTGAVFLVSKDVCKVARFGWNKQGEDEVFCRSVRDNGFELYCDVSLYSQHIMNEDILKMYLNGELKYNNGEVVRI